MRIYTKKAFMFRQPVTEKPKLDDGSDNPEYLSAIKKSQVVTTKAHEFQDVPDWVKKDLMFQWGSSDGDIEVIESKKQEKEVELEAEAEVEIKETKRFRNR